MWKCPKCNRMFKTTNQSHSCLETTIDDIFLDRPIELVLAFDRIMTTVLEWENCTVGAAKKAVVFTSKKAWLIVRPMSKELDLKFYYDEPIDSPLFKKIPFLMGKYNHHLRIRHEDEVTPEIIGLLRQGYLFSLK